MTKRNYKPKITVSMDDRQLKEFWSLLANLEGPEDRIAEIGNYKIDPDNLPDELAFEALLLKVYYKFHKDANRGTDTKIPPTRENLLGYLETNGFEDAAQRLDNILLHKTDDEDVFTPAYFLADWIQRQRLFAALRKAENRLRQPEGDIQQVYADMMSILNRAAPNSNTQFEERHKSDMFQVLEERNQQVAARMAQGFAPAPQYPWKSLQELISTFEKGDIGLFSAETKFGKSTFAGIIAEDIAYRQGYYVLFLHVETTPLALAHRIAARELKIRTDAIRTGRVDLKQEPFASHWNNAVQKAKQQEQAGRGVLAYLHCPGLRTSDVDHLIAEHKARAESKDLELMVILDYLQIMDPKEFDANRWNSLGQTAGALQRIVNEHQVYFLLLAQDQMNNSNDDDTHIFGVSEIQRTTQHHVRLKRKVADTDAPFRVTNPATGEREQSRDFMGQPMWLHRKGELDSQCTLKVIRANNDRKGKVDNIYIAGAYFTIIEVPCEDTKTL